MKRSFFGAAVAAIVVLAAIMVIRSDYDAASIDQTNVQNSQQVSRVTNASNMNDDVAIDTQNSVIEWVGRAIGKEHTGTITVKEGAFDMDGVTIIGARVVIDMNSIVNKDLDQQMQERLVTHLKSGDFFNASAYPEAQLIINNIERTADTDLAKMTADLTIKDVTQPVVFYGRTGMENDRAIIDVDMKIDRTVWNVTFRSEKYLEGAGIQPIDDNITFKMKLVSEPIS